MKRLIKGLLAMTTLLLSSCGSKVVVVKTYHCLSYTNDRVDPRYCICDLKNDYTGETWTWEGIIDKWVPDYHLSYYFSGYLFEYSNGTRTMLYGTLR